MISSTRLKQAYGHSRLNRRFIVPGTKCRCFHCLSAFSAEEITQWTDGGNTALCPRCGVDAVLASSATALSETLIRDLHAEYFETSHKYTEQEWRSVLGPDGKLAAGGE